MLRRLEDHALQRLAPHAYAVVAVTGIGGQGKSRLLEELAARVQQAGYGVLRLDFDLAAQRDPIVGPLHLRQQLAGLGYPTWGFDAAYAKLFALLRPGRDIRADHPELFAFGPPMGEELLGLVWDIVAKVPGGGIAAKLAERMASTAREWYRSRGSALIARLDGMGEQELRNELPFFLGADLRAGKGQPPCLLIDTFEAAARDEAGQHAAIMGAAEIWIRRLIAEAPGVPVVIAGRTAPEWAEHDSSWAGAINVMSLEELKPSEVDQLLDSEAVSDEAVSRRLREVAKGHPLTLRLLLRIHASIAAEGRVAVPADFPAKPREVLEHVLRHLDPVHRAIVKVLSVTSSVDRAMWQSLAGSGFSVFDLKAADDILDDVLFIQQEGGSFALHELVREHLLEVLTRSEPDLLQRARLAVFAHLDRSVRSASAVANRNLALPEAASLLLAADPVRYPAWLRDLYGGKNITGGSRHLPGLVERGFAADPQPRLQEALDLATVLSRIDPWSPRLAIVLDQALREVERDELKPEQLSTLVPLALRQAQFVSDELAKRLLRGLVRQPSLTIGPEVELQLRDACGDPSFDRINELLASDWTSCIPQLCRFLIHKRDSKNFVALGEAMRDLLTRVGGEKWTTTAVIVFEHLAINGAVAMVPVVGRHVFACEDDTDILRNILACAAKCPMQASQLVLTMAEGRLAENNCDAAMLLAGDVLSAPFIDTLTVTLGQATWLDDLGEERLEIASTHFQELWSKLPGKWQQTARVLRMVRCTHREQLTDANVITRLDNLLSLVPKRALPPFPWSPDLINQASFPGNTTHAKTKMELAVNDRGEVIVFYNDPVFIAWTELFLLKEEYLVFAHPQYGFLNFGIPITPELLKYIESGGKFLCVLMNDSTFEPECGGYFSVLIVP
jgi:hypothetical protein